MKNTYVRWVTRTAILIALLIVFQVATASLGNKIITGSLVNLILVISVMVCGLSTGLTVAVLSPIFAKFLGIGPFWALIPFIALGNATLVFVWELVFNKFFKEKNSAYVIGVIAAAVAKFVVLYIGIVKFAVPVLLDLPAKQAGVISAMFSVPQLITATIGGVLACVVYPLIKKAIK